MFKKVCIITSGYFKNDMSRGLGGIEHYVFCLSTLLSKFYEVHIFDLSDYSSFNIHSNGIFCHRLFVKNRKKIRTGFKIIRNEIKKCIDEDFLTIYSDDYLSLYNSFHPSISIQHGVAWDVVYNQSNFLKLLKLIPLVLRKNKQISKNDVTVCVDYNYQNWIKATYLRKENFNKLCVITNFAVPQDTKKQKDNDHVNICFARRLVKYRGTHLFMNAIKELSLDKDIFDLTHFYIAGNGLDEVFLKENLKNFENVSFSSYKSEDSYKFHQGMDIAVVPTLGSEGTSLSLLEAMASSCAVICTPVGGMTNIILDGYNGLIADFNPSSLCELIKKLVCDKDLRRRLGQNARATIESSFSKDNWDSKWIELVKKYDC